MKTPASRTQRHATAPRQPAAHAVAGQTTQRLRSLAPSTVVQREAQEEDMMMKRDPARPLQRVEEEELLQGKALQRAQEEDMLQGKALQRVEEEEMLQGREAGPGSMPLALQAGVRQLAGEDISNVQVHRNSNRPAGVGALAYAQGNDIHLGAGQEQHLAHEAWHVVQQRQGRVQPTMQMAGTSINDNPALESEADAMGAKALQAGQAAVQAKER